jgi:hypothetical protein
LTAPCGYRRQQNALAVPAESTGLEREGEGGGRSEGDRSAFLSHIRSRVPEAEALKDLLVRHAAQTKDHNTSDGVVNLIEARKAVLAARAPVIAVAAGGEP